MSHCPSCGATLISDPIGAPLRCKDCPWHLVTLAEWSAMSSFQKGYVHYMQSAWPTSDLAGQKNPYPQGSADWAEFCRGEQRALLNAQDGEE